ncbi:MAG: cbb3-type cytochrome oxidase assembly protein CcoS [Bradymonadia bacterium]
MGVIYLLIPLALGIMIAAVLTFWWAARDGQFDDMDTPAVRVLFDDAHTSHAQNAAPQNAAGAPTTPAHRGFDRSREEMA